MGTVERNASSDFSIGGVSYGGAGELAAPESVREGNVEYFEDHAIMDGKRYRLYCDYDPYVDPVLLIPDFLRVRPEDEARRKAAWDAYVPVKTPRDMEREEWKKHNDALIAAQKQRKTERTRAYFEKRRAEGYRYDRKLGEWVKRDDE